MLLFGLPYLVHVGFKRKLTWQSWHLKGSSNSNQKTPQIMSCFQIYMVILEVERCCTLKVSMRVTGHKKFHGVSLIEVNDGAAEFYSLDKRHPETEEIYGALMGLTKLLRSSGYVRNILELGQGAYHD